jgi:HPt (histidine-containing phosphotransfer) domain-containing protein
MRSAINADDAESLKNNAHKLKGGASMLGAAQTVELCEKLESQAVRGSLNEAVALVEQIRSSFQRTHAALLEEVG